MTPGTEFPAIVPIQLEKHIPTLAYSIGAIRDFRTSWNEPKPTENAPAAASMPYTACPVMRPTASDTAMVTAHRPAARGKKFAQ
ncbi:MAG: hypothetical protein WB781_27260 [Candidatus Sulfotelmatobacter sp.]